MKKKGVSETVSLSLIILIALTAVSILAILIYAIIQGGNLSNVETLSYSSKINVVTGSMVIAQGQMSLKVKRNNVAANIVGFSVIIEDVDGRRFIHEENEPIVALETKSIELNYDVTLGEIKKVAIVPKFSVDGEVKSGDIETDYIVKTFDFSCGDGTDGVGEECDTTEDSATCDYDLGDGPQACTSPLCGDNYLNTVAGEGCDDSGTNPGDGCSATCQIECGDGIRDTVDSDGYSEECDDGNNDDGDGCSATCQDESCSIPSDCTGDGNACTDNTCIGGVCGTSNNVAACNDNDACTNGDVCSAGSCSGTLDPACNACSIPSDCTGDANACTDNTCIGGVCGTSNNVDACDDANACTNGDVCLAGGCQAGTPLTCDDGIACTTDSCDPNSGCSVDTSPCECPNGLDSECNDANVCNGIETCDASLVCQAGTSLTCGDGNSCTTDSCDPTSGCANDPLCPAEQYCNSGVCCSLTGASWSDANVVEGTQVTLTVTGSTGCNGLEVNFDIFEDDVGFDATDDPSSITPSTGTFVSGSASATWIAEWQCDGSVAGFCAWGNPEWYFDASLVFSSGTTLRSSDPKLVVTETPATCGNEFVQTGEECDDGNAVDTDECSNACIITTCGDGIIQNPNGAGTVEQCDDSNTDSGDGCSATCQDEVATASACQDVPPSGATHFWLADGNADDIVGSVTGTLNGAATYVDGVAGQAFDFSNIGDTVVFDQTAAITGTASYTIDFWVKSNVGPSSTDIFEQGNSNIKFSFELAGSMCFISELEGITESIICAGPDIMTDGNYHHIAGVRDVPNTKAILYVDGVEVGTYPIGTIADHPAGDIILGRINGAVDELGFYNRALTPTEILDIYNSGGAEVYLSASEDLTNLPNQNFNNFCWRESSIEEGTFSCTDVCQDRGGVAEANCDWRESPLTSQNACSYFNPGAVLQAPSPNSYAPYFYDLYTTNNGYCYGAKQGSSSSCTSVGLSKNNICTCIQPTSNVDCGAAGGYWDSIQSRCWIQGNYEGTCNDVCAPYGGIYVDPTSSGGCDWAAIQPADCAACIALNPGAICGGGNSAGPFYTPTQNNCITRIGTSTSCSYSRKYERQCACNEEQVPSCGNGFIQSGETCDDGNVVAGDGCSATCQIECGDGIAQAGEQCDTLADSATCNYNLGTGSFACTLAECGDGYWNTAAGEQCDYGGDLLYDCDATTCQSPLVCQDSQDYTSCAAEIASSVVGSAAECQTACATEIDSDTNIDSGCWIWDSAANTCSCGSGVGTPAATPTGSSGGLCQLCPGWWDGTYCWHEGEPGQSCSTVCVPFGGTFYENTPGSLGQCDWVNDDPLCATCLHFNPGAATNSCSSTGIGPTFSPALGTPPGSCRYHDGSNSCYSANPGFTRQCACNQ